MRSPTIELGPARLAEAVEIASISRRDIEAGLGWRWRPASIALHIRGEDSCVVVAREGPRIVGFAVMGFRFEHDDAHLLLLAVIPSHRRRGVATRLLDWLEVMALRAGVRRVLLEVRESATPARRFYAARGFAKTERIPGYYQEREAALRLEKRLGGEAEA